MFGAGIGGPLVGAFGSARGLTIAAGVLLLGGLAPARTLARR